ncbi:hypothetical protein BS47DRAFT_1304445 [Hydnum rufescens UP504]|uniref:T6SS Phospholipase effector Tle1-like catalytic domain-containing protein n=1 Tax=Hydnum rufescens UP504 TaxID=1448309 RepID=A0A9P6AJW5_9AGAM|nr:hypothetical protein BS47DRAFT_1304445 [Hydnum rufescens UP504]
MRGRRHPKEASTSQSIRSAPSTPPRNSTETEPEINTIRASPEDIRGPSAVRHSSDDLEPYEIDPHRLHSPPASPGKSPHPDLPSRRSGRSSTSPIPSNVASVVPRVHKRIIICCDGTWQDGIVQRHRWKYSNILKLSRCIRHQDSRHHTQPIPQIVFYQSGLGSEDNIYTRLIDAEKVQEAYAFIAQNYHAGDEIFLFGFSRGAYTARMVATLIGELGVLNRSEMDNFADIFIAFQRRGRTQDPISSAEYEAILAPLQNSNSEGRRQVEDRDFSIKVVGVFDTVGALGLPHKINLSNKAKTLFNFPDKILGEHIERAYHAISLDEQREDFDVTKFHQTNRGKEMGQILRQCWFAGSHSDVGGGFQDHDLSDLTLIWMIVRRTPCANVEDVLAIDTKYIKSLLKPVQPWGKQIHHYSLTGVFTLAGKIERRIEKKHETNEKIHSSALEQVVVNPIVRAVLREHPDMLEKHLLPLEDEMKQGWSYDPWVIPSREDTLQANKEARSMEKALESLKRAARKAASLNKRVSMMIPELTEDPNEVVDMRFQESAMDKVWEDLTDDP